MGLLLALKMADTVVQKNGGFGLSKTLKTESLRLLGLAHVELLNP